MICSATNYYVKNSGSDVANGLLPATAWQTINKINTSTFLAGDTIFFNRGDTWRETLTVPSSGTSSAYIVFSSYGTGALPKIYGSEFEDTWTHGDIPGAAANNDLLTESFEGAGYENTWSELIGTNESNLIDEDNTDVARPTGGGNQILKIVKDITPDGSGAAARARTTYDLTTIRSAAYADFYVRINAQGLTSVGNHVDLFQMNDGVHSAGILELINTSDGIKFATSFYVNSTDTYNAYPANGSITYDQWYHIQIEYDITNGTYSTSIDGLSVAGGTITGTSSTGIRYVHLGSGSESYTLTAYFDLVNISSTNFYIPTITIPDNVWVSDGDYINPYILSKHGNIYYKETNGSIIWGKVQKNFVTDLVAEYDWTWVKGATEKICIYSPTDPNTRYTGVEIAQRSACVYLNLKQYLCFDGLELGYTGRWGITAYYDFPFYEYSGLIVRNCYIHHGGGKIDAAGGDGYGLALWYSDMLIQNNIIHDFSRRLISLNIGVQVIYPHNIVIEGNILHDGYHSSGVDLEANGTGCWDSIIVRNNLFYQNQNPIDAIENPAVNNIFIDQESTGTITKLYIYNNMFLNENDFSIMMQKVDEVYIYNNTFYGDNLSATQLNGAFIGIQYAGNYTVKNNIFYNGISHLTNANFRSLSIAATAGTVTSDYNLFYNTDALQTLITWRGTGYVQSQWGTYKTTSGQDVNSQTPTDPLLYSLTNFGLRSGSPAIGAGVNLGILTDYTGHFWSDPPSLGALEFGSTIAPLLRSGVKLLRSSTGNLLRQ
jgi:hypothetical protein